MKGWIKNEIYELEKHSSLRSLLENHMYRNNFNGIMSLKMNVNHKGKTKLCSLYSYLDAKKNILETFLFCN